ncbi:MAG: tRNA pseudouridine(55) synthase TruB, partial [Chlamydiia bacterium]|nr:tRNA pseudouridine(55) synthase TruB [Chlamydiia bacterium]
MLIGREFTRKSDQFLSSDKQYEASLHLGICTDSYDKEGQITSRSPHIPTPHEIELVIASFQGEMLQVPPMFSAKKVQGKKLYDLARRGITIERQSVLVRMQIALLEYSYPKLSLRVDCSKGTYIRSLGHDLGQALGCGAHLHALRRTRSGHFSIAECLPHAHLKTGTCDLTSYMRRS